MSTTIQDLQARLESRKKTTPSDVYSLQERLNKARQTKEQIRQQREQTLESLDTSPLREQMAEKELQIQRHQKNIEKLRSQMQAGPNVADKAALEIGAEQQAIQRLQEERNILEGGVLTRKGSQEGRFETGFAASHAFAMDFIRRKVSDKTGKDIPVRVGPQSGELEIFDPESNRWMLHDEFGITMSDFKEMIGESLTYGGDILGSIIGVFIGGAATKTPTGIVTGEVAGSYAGTRAGETARLEIGRDLGVNVGLTDDQVSRLASEQGKLAAMGTIIGHGLMSAGKRLLAGPRPFTSEQAQLINEAMMESDAVIAKINERIDSEKVFNPTVGQRSELDSVLDQEATLAGGEPGIDKAFRARQRENEAALIDFYNAAFDLKGGTSYEVVASAKAKMMELPSERLKKAEEIASKTNRVAENEIQNLPLLDEPLTGKQIRESLIQERQQILDLENEAWARTRRLAGEDPDTFTSNVQIPRSESLNRVISQLSAEARRSLTGSAASSKSTLISRLLKKEEDGISIIDVNGDPLLTIRPNEEPLDILQINAALHDLRRQYRVAAKGLSTESPQLRDVQRLIDSLTKTRNDWLKENFPELLSETLSAEQITRARSELYDRGVVGGLLKEVSPGEYALADRDVVTSVIRKKNGGAARELAAAVMADPRGMQSIRQHIYGLYRSEVEVDGVLNIQLHNKFMKDYGDTIRPFFTREDMSQLQNLGEMAVVVERHNRKLAKIKEDFANSFRGKIRDMNPESIARAFFGLARRESKVSFDHEDARRLRNFADRSGVLTPIRGVLTDEIKRRIFRGGKFNHQSLTSLIDDHGHKIQEFFGDQYFRDLKTLASATNIVSKKGKRLAASGQPEVVKLSRAILRPLSRKQRLITYGVHVKSTAADAALANAVMDPDKLRKLIFNWQRDMKSAEVVALLSSLHAIDLQVDPEE